MRLKALIHGFTLIELSAVLLIISLLVASILTVETQKIRAEKQTELAVKLDAIQKALYEYRLMNDQLPCPGDATKDFNNSWFGVAADSAASACHSGTNASARIATTGNNVFGGIVPVRTLGLSDDYAMDPWGRFFTYYIDKNTNAANAFSSGTTNLGLTGNLTVKDESNTTALMLDSNNKSQVMAAIVSHGPSGHGGFIPPVSGAKTRFSASNSNPRKLSNCMCSSAAADAYTATATLYMQRNSSTSSAYTFDDTVRIMPRSFFYTYGEKAQ